MMANRESSLEALIRKGLEELVDTSFMVGDCGGTPSSCAVTPYLTSQAQFSTSTVTGKNLQDNIRKK